LAVTVLLAVIESVIVWLALFTAPVQPVNVAPPLVAGAVRVTVVPDTRDVFV
jgi:hypothetical protein